MVARAESAYQSLAAELRRQLLQHAYDDGRRLPTEAELSAEHKLSRQTVRRAFQELVVEGLVYRVKGRGTFAAPPDRRYLRQFGSISDLMSFSVDTELKVLQPLRSTINLAAAGRLRCATDRVYRLRFLRLHEQVPFSVTDMFLVPEIGDGLLQTPELSVRGSVSQVTVIGLIEALGLSEISQAEQSITAIAASPANARDLRCAVNEPLLRIDRLYLNQDERPIELAVAHFLPEQYSYRVHLRRG